MRWFASGGVFLLITLVHLLTPIDLDLPPLYAGNAVLVISNVVYRLVARGTLRRRLVEFQLFGDLFLLAWFVSLSGGLENPFVSFASFHMIIASIFLTPGQAYGAASLATLLLAVRPVGEAVGLLPHRHFAGFLLDDGGGPGLLLTLSRLGALAATLYLTVYLTTTVVKELNRHRRWLVIANIRLEEQHRHQSRYVRVVSHDIRASVSAISSCLRVVLDGLTGGICGKSHEMVQRAELRSASLLRFLEELAYLSALRSETPPPRSLVSLSEAIERAVGAAGDRIAAKRLGIEVAAPGDLRLEAHGDILQRLVACLLDNAIAYTPEGGSIRLQANAHREGDRVELVVRDTGIGIPRDEMPRVLEDFYRGSNARRVLEEGAGLGLAIAKEIVKGYGGAIAIEAGTPSGTWVSVTLPRGLRPQEGRQA